MSARVKLAGSDSFLNRLLVMREQEVLNLSKKLHHQVALDSDGGSGASEGSLGSPERNSISSPPPTSPHPRLHSPTSDANQEFLPAADLKPEFLPDGTRLHYRNCRSEDRYDDHHYDHPDPLHHQHLQHNSDYRHHEHSKGQVDQSHRPYEAEKHDDRLPFIRGSYDHNDDNSWGSYDTQSDRYQEVEEEEEEQQQDGGPEEGNEGSKMEMSILHERLQHQQQMALAARALLGTLTSPAQQPSLLSFPHQLHPESPQAQNAVIKQCTLNQILPKSNLKFGLCCRDVGKHKSDGTSSGQHRPTSTQGREEAHSGHSQGRQVLRETQEKQSCCQKVS
ncbi:uncharacterized protein [Procambarus clarkii]|uniref:uncharacterized protein isoform X2 n=1 Tax=Procambarus clarkii TaxID=6728 RepID=UPI00374278B6